MQSAFKSFTNDAPEMDGRTFVKLCKDTGLLAGGLTTTDCDLIFTKVKSKGAKKINYKEFQEAMKQVAEKKKISLDDVKAQLSKGGPVYAGTKADEVRFHDDKSTYTGVHAHGGPSTTDAKFSDLSQITDRSSANIRGVNEKMNEKIAAKK
eukprot:Platyproteum_vivax@DN12259_c0_g1_i1.p1